MSHDKYEIHQKMSFTECLPLIQRGYPGETVMIHNNYLYFLKLESYHLLKYVRYHHGLYEYEDSRKEKYLLARKLTEYQRSSITYINAAGVTRTISSLDDRTIHLQQAAV